MEDGSITFTIIGILIFLSALLSGAESALLSLPESKIRAMKDQKLRGIFFLEKLKKNQKQVIIAILLGSNTVNILIPTIGTLWVTSHYGNTPQEDLAMGISTFTLTVLILLFGEILPKSFAVTYNEKFSLYVAPFLYFFTRIFSSVVWFFEKLSDIITPSGENKGISEAEVLAMVAMSEEHGEITTKEKVRIKNLLDFSNTLVSEVMTPRTKIIALEEDQTLLEAKNVFKKDSHSRMPIYEDNIDKITKIITLRDIWEASDEYGDEKLVKNLDLRSPYFVPVTKKIADLFEDFQRQRTHLAIIVDEHGGTAGLITMEDIFEEIFGEIRDETDTKEMDEVQNLQQGVWRVSPRMTISEILEETTIAISEKNSDQEKTLSFLVLEKLGRFPRKGEIIRFGTIEVVVEKMNGHTVDLFRIVKK